MFNGFYEALLVLAGYLLINLVFGNILEPRIMGRGLGLSTLVVFLSLIFWGWLLGPVGMLLSVPLTIIVKIALEQTAGGQSIAVLLSDLTKSDGLRRGRQGYRAFRIASTLALASPNSMWVFSLKNSGFCTPA